MSVLTFTINIIIIIVVISRCSVFHCHKAGLLTIECIVIIIKHTYRDTHKSSTNTFKATQTK